MTGIEGGTVEIRNRLQAERDLGPETDTQVSALHHPFTPLNHLRVFSFSNSMSFDYNARWLGVGAIRRGGGVNTHYIFIPNFFQNN